MKPKLKFWTFLFIFVSLSKHFNAANILGIFPFAGVSHHGFHQGMMESLTKAGHKVTVISAFPPRHPIDNYTYVNSLPSTSKKIYPDEFDDMKPLSWLDVGSVALKEVRKECYDIMQIEEVQNLLKTNEKKYDVLFVQLLPMYECYLPIAHKFNIPVVGTFSARPWAEVDVELGNPHPIIYPFLFSSFARKMTLYERIANAIHHLTMQYIYKFVLPAMLQEFFNQYYPNYDWRSHKEISLLFTNNHPILFPKPVVPNVVEIGGIHLNPPKPLPENFKKFLDESENGVILFSVGTIAGPKTVNENIRGIFRNAFAELPQRVIWKLDEEIENLPKNVWLTKWMPQKDILAHKNVKAFISHGGMSGVYESIYMAKPMILTPVFFDQPSNAALLQELGVGVCLDLQFLTKDILLNAIHAVVNNNSYTENMKELSKYFKDRLVSPQESVVYWTEYVIRHNGTRHLRAVASDIPLYQYFSIDIVSLFAVTIFVILFAFIYVSKKLYNLIVSDHHRSMSKKKAVMKVK